MTEITDAPYQEPVTRRACFLFPASFGLFLKIQLTPGRSQGVRSSVILMRPARLGRRKARAEVRLTAEQICDAGVIADSHTSLHGNVFLYDDIAEIDDIAEMPKLPILPNCRSR